MVDGSLKSWILEFEEYLKTPFEEGGSGRYFSIPITNPDSFKILFDEFITRWPKGIEMNTRGYFYMHEGKMIYSKISAVSVVDKWAPHSIKQP